MSYDFIIQQVDVPAADVVFPEDFYDFAAGVFRYRAVPIEDASKFWQRVASFPGLDCSLDKGSEGLVSVESLIPGFAVYPLYDYPQEFTSKLAAKAFPSMEAIMEAKDAIRGPLPLIGLHIDLWGNGNCLLSFYEHMHAEFPKLLIRDKQTDKLHDAESARVLTRKLGMK